MYENNPESRVFIEKQIKLLCKYAVIICPIGEDMDSMVDKIITDQPNNRKLGDMLQEYHNKERINPKTQSINDKKQRESNQAKEITNWSNEQKEAKRLERQQKIQNATNTDPNASPFGDSFK